MARQRTIGQVAWTPSREVAIRKATAIIRAAAEDAARESGQFVLDHERAHVPVRTGRTRLGLRMTLSGQDGLFEAEVAERDPGRVAVAVFLNSGTARMPATRFVDNAVAAERRRMTRRVTRHVRGRLGGDK